MKKITCVLFFVIAIFNFMDYADSKPRKKFGCLWPVEPLYGGFKFNRGMRSLEIVCEEGFQLIGTPKNWYCVRGKWEDDLYMIPRRTLNFFDNCATPFASLRKCPRLQAPSNGKVITLSRKVDGKAIFRCNEDYIIDGSDERICLLGNVWSGEQPICRRLKTIGDMADLIKDEMISKLSSATADSEDGLQSKLAVGKSGLDIIFALDVSASIGDKSLEIAKDFIKLLIKTFSVSPDPSGGKNGTRIALITFASQANITFNLDDPKVRSVEAAFESIETIKNTRGGTNFRLLFRRIFNIFHEKIEDEESKKKDATVSREKDATRAIFILTDAEGNSNSATKKSDWDLLKNHSFDIFTVGVGHSNQFKLSVIASEPYNTHVFILNKMTDLERIAEIISEKNIDYGQCGISGNTEIRDDSGEARMDSWPWIGWVNVYDETSPKTCGGYLVCRRYFVTTATCVTMKTDDGNMTTVDKKKIIVTLGDHKLFEPDPNEVQVRVFDIQKHPQYTGKPNEYGVREYDIALLDFGSDREKQPVFNKHIRPICMASSLNSRVYTFSDNKRIHLQLNWNKPAKRGFVAGWGHRVEPSFDYPEGVLTQNKRNMKSNILCKKRFPSLDTKKFFCVANQRESDSCKKTDIGGPYMDKISENKQYSVLGMALHNKDCDQWHKFSIFLNTLQDDIVTWLGQFLSDCNRAEEIIPTTPVTRTTTDATAEPLQEQ